MAENKPVQQFAFSDVEIALIKGLFTENETVVNAVRNHFLQFEKTAEHGAALAMLTKEHKAFLRKLFVPMANASQGIQRISDAWGSIETNNGAEQTYPVALAREWQLDYMEQQLKLLDGIGEEKMTLASLVARPLPRNPQEVFINIHSRKSIFILVDQQLALVLMFAGHKDESIDDMKKRLQKDSSK